VIRQPRKAISFENIDRENPYQVRDQEQIYILIFKQRGKAVVKPENVSEEER